MSLETGAYQCDKALVTSYKGPSKPMTIAPNAPPSPLNHPASSRRHAYNFQHMHNIIINLLWILIDTRATLYMKDSQRSVMHTLIFQNQQCVREGLK